MTGQVTRLLDQIASGDANANPVLFEQVYSTLRSMARARLARERPGHTLSPTALVNEAYMRLVGSSTSFQHRRHFFASAARAMRRILIDYARQQGAARRGGSARPVTLGEDVAHDALDPEALLDLDQALTHLAGHDEQLAEIVQLHFFGGFSFAEIGAMFEVSERTVLRRWRVARAWIGGQTQTDG